MTQEEQIKQVAEYDGFHYGKVTGWMSGDRTMFYKKDDRGAIEEIYPTADMMKYHTSLDWLNPVWVKVYAEVKNRGLAGWNLIIFANNYHAAINEGNIPAALIAVSDAITWLKEQKK